MIALALAACLAIATPEPETLQTRSEPQFRARRFSSEDYYIRGAVFDFVVIEPRGEYLAHRPQEIWDIDGELVAKLEGWRTNAFGASQSPYRIFDYLDNNQPTGIRGILTKDGTIQETVGIPFGSGELVFESEEGVIAFPTNRTYRVLRDGRYLFQTLSYNAAGRYRVSEGRELRAIPGLDTIADPNIGLTNLSFVGHGMIVGRTTLQADSESASELVEAMSLPANRIQSHRDIHPEAPYQMAPRFVSVVSFVWRDGAVEVLPKPADYVLNIDGSRTPITGWWGVIGTPDGRIIGFAECGDSERGVQAKHFVAEWDGGSSRVLPIPGDIVGMFRAGETSLGHVEIGEGLTARTVPTRDITYAPTTHLSADAYGNISFSPSTTIGDGETFLWDGNRWHNVNRAVGADFGPYYLHLTSERGKAFLISRGSGYYEFGEFVGHSTCWIVEF